MEIYYSYYAKCSTVFTNETLLMSLQCSVFMLCAHSLPDNVHGAEDLADAVLLDILYEGKEVKMIFVSRGDSGDNDLQ